MEVLNKAVNSSHLGCSRGKHISSICPRSSSTQNPTAGTCWGDFGANSSPCSVCDRTREGICFWREPGAVQESKASPRLTSATGSSGCWRHRSAKGSLSPRERTTALKRGRGTFSPYIITSPPTRERNKQTGKGVFRAWSSLSVQRTQT